MNRRATTLLRRWFFSFLVIIVSLSLAMAARAASWKPTAANRPSTCATLWRAIGLPRDINAASRDTTFVCHKRFALSHDNATKTPDWVIERLTRRQVSGKYKRPQDTTFTEEKRVPPHGRARNADYSHTKNHLARGHMAPSADFSQSLNWMKDTFVLSNAVPQVGRSFNSGIWARLEAEVRKVAKARGEIYVITGLVRGDANTRSRIIARSDNACGREIMLAGPKGEAFICAEHNAKKDVFCKKGVAVPIGIYKIVYDPKTASAYAFVMPNTDHPDRTGEEAQFYLDKFRVSVAALEGATGLQFFRALPPDRRNKAVQQCATDSFWIP